MDLLAQLSLMYAGVNMPPAVATPPPAKQGSPAQQSSASRGRPSPGSSDRQAEAGAGAEALDFDVDELLVWSQGVSWAASWGAQCQLALVSAAVAAMS